MLRRLTCAPDCLRGTAEVSLDLRFERFLVPRGRDLVFGLGLRDELLEDDEEEEEPPRKITSVSNVRTSSIL